MPIDQGMRFISYSLIGRYTTGLLNKKTDAIISNKRKREASVLKWC